MSVCVSVLLASDFLDNCDTDLPISMYVYMYALEFAKGKPILIYSYLAHYGTIIWLHN